MIRRRRRRKIRQHFAAPADSDRTICRYCSKAIHAPKVKYPDIFQHVDKQLYG